MSLCQTRAEKSDVSKLFALTTQQLLITVKIAPLTPKSYENLVGHHSRVFTQTNSDSHLRPSKAELEPNHYSTDHESWT